METGITVSILIAVVTLSGVTAPLTELMAQEGRIEGRVLVGEAGVDDADVTVQGLGRRVRADGAGRFAFDRIPPGTYIVEAESPAGAAPSATAPAAPATRCSSSAVTT